MKPDPKAGVLEVSVTDGGPGIQPKTCLVFSNASIKDARKLNMLHRGSGLGLALAKKVVEAHGGRIWIESEATKGTTVRLSTPNETSGTA